MRRAKIVCTIGPAVESIEKITELVDAGMNMARLNLSHGAHAEHQTRLDNVRTVAKKSNKAVAVLVDLQGPKIRLGRFKNGPHDLAKGDIFVITTEDIEGTKERVGTTYKGLPGDCRTGVAVSVPAMSEKDIADLKWALKAGVDFIALSFVRNAKDVNDVHKVMDEIGVRLPIIAKIEKPQAVENLQEIVDAFDGIMVARGDLGVELPIEDVPMVQKRCITLARESAKPVIVATQMLDSMISNSQPTRAEATDCANAVLDGADALMLSGETSVGDFPIESVKIMARIIERTEEIALDQIPPLKHSPATKGGAITKAATEVGLTVGAKYLVAFTQSGDSARRMSRLRSPIPMLALTPDSGTYNRLALSWGVESMLTSVVNHTDEMVMQVDTILINSKRVNIGDLVLIVAGSPPGIPGSINAMRVHKIGDAVSGVAPAYRK